MNPIKFKSKLVSLTIQPSTEDGLSFSTNYHDYHSTIYLSNDEVDQLISYLQKYRKEYMTQAEK